jgi:hypothetical protein
MDPALLDLVEELIVRIQAGECIDLAAWLGNHPNQAEQMRDLLLLNSTDFANQRTVEYHPWPEGDPRPAETARARAETPTSGSSRDEESFRVAATIGLLVAEAGKRVWLTCFAVATASRSGSGPP